MAGGCPVFHGWSVTAVHWGTSQKARVFRLLSYALCGEVESEHRGFERKDSRSSLHFTCHYTEVSRGHASHLE